jgi:hypothetical protein
MAARTLIEREALVVAVIGMWTALLFVLMPALVVSDTWLSLVDGRLIAQHWLPHHDTLTLWTLGRPWIDQQWGAHLALYELAAHGGLRAALGAGVACVGAALVVVAVASRKLGASQRSTALALMVPIVAAPWLVQLRSQSFGLVLFAGVYALLACDARRPGKRVLWVLPLLVLWANLHGSVALGAGLSLLYGLFAARRQGSRMRGLLLACGAPLCVLASPYGFRLIPYYRLMLFHPPLASFVNEWQPAKVAAYTAIFFGSAFVMSALWGARRDALTPFERWALPLLLIGALTAVRNTVWFELGAAVALPRLLDAVWPAQTTLTPSIRRANLLIGSATLAVVVAVGVIELTRPQAWFDHGASPAAAAAVSRAAGSDGAVLADDEHSDWLLWFEPALTGRVDFDVRFELFSRAELDQIVLLRGGSHPVWRRCGSLARVVTFDGPGDEQSALREGVLAKGSATIVRSPTFVAVAQPVAASGERCTI